MTMRSVKNFPMMPPVGTIIADIQPLTNAIALLPQAAIAQAILDALNALPKPATKAREITVSLDGALVDSPINLGTLTSVQAITVLDLTGASTPTLKLNGAGEAALSLAKGDVRDGFQVTSLFLSCPGGGGSITLELHGR